MILQPINDAIFGLPLEHVDKEALQLAEEMRQETEAWRGNISLMEKQAADNSVRVTEAILADPEFVFYQVEVIAVGPDVRVLSVGDIAIIPQDSGGMVTVIDPDTQQYRRVYVNNEKHILARYVD